MGRSTYSRLFYGCLLDMSHELFKKEDYFEDLDDMGNEDVGISTVSDYDGEDNAIAFIYIKESLTLVDQRESLIKEVDESKFLNSFYDHRWVNKLWYKLIEKYCIKYGFNSRKGKEPKWYLTTEEW